MATPVPQSAQKGWRAFSTSFEATYGAEVVPCGDPPSNFISLNFEGLPFTQNSRLKIDDGEEKTGSYGGVPTFGQVVTWGSGGSHDRRIRPADVALITSMALCSGATTDLTGAYKHSMIADESTISLKSRTLMEYDGIVKYYMPGISCLSFGLESKRGDMIRFKSTMIGTGEAITATEARPSQTAEDYLYSGDLKIFTGGTYTDGTHSITGGTNRSTELVDISFGYNTNGKPRDIHGQNTGYAAGVDSESVEITLECTFEADADTWEAKMAAQTTEAIQILAVGAQIGLSGQYETIEYILPMCQVTDVKKDESGTTAVRKVTFTVMRDTTNSYPPVVENIITALADIGF